MSRKEILGTWLNGVKENVSQNATQKIEEIRKPMLHINKQRS